MRTVASFFTGCGGFDVGLEGGFHYLGKFFEPNGFKTIFSCDVWPPTKKVYDANFGPKDGRELTCESIVDVVKAHETNPLPQTDLVTGGFPCQDFSTSGKRLGFSSFKNHLGEKAECVPEESRGMLYFWMCKAVYAMRPKVFIAENVKGLATIDGAKEKIIEDFASMGYHVGYKIVCAADYGVPQNRERIIFIGVRKEKLNAASKDILLKSAEDWIAEDLIVSMMPPKTHLKHLTCRDAFKGLTEPRMSKDPDQKVFSKAAYLPSKGQGQGEIRIDMPARTIRSEHHGNIEYRRLSLEHGGRLTGELEGGLKERRLTVKECARLQSFPDDFQFVPIVSGSTAYKLIGNAVPPVLAHAIGKQLTAKWDSLFS